MKGSRAPFVLSDLAYALRLLSSGFICVVASVSTAFLFLADRYSLACVYHMPLTHSSFGGHSDRFHPLAVVCDAAVNTGSQIYLYIHKYTNICLSPCFQFFSVSTRKCSCYILWIGCLFCFFVFLLLLFFCIDCLCFLATLSPHGRVGRLAEGSGHLPFFLIPQGQVPGPLALPQ